MQETAIALLRGINVGGKNKHCPEGLARTPLTNAYFESKLKTISTSRNWRTTLKLLELANA